MCYYRIPAETLRLEGSIEENQLLECNSKMLISAKTDSPERSRAQSPEPRAQSPLTAEYAPQKLLKANKQITYQFE